MKVDFLKKILNSTVLGEFPDDIITCGVKLMHGVLKSLPKSFVHTRTIMLCASAL